MWWFIPEGVKETLDWWMVNLTNLKNDEWFYDCNKNITASNVYSNDRLNTNRRITDKDELLK